MLRKRKRTTVREIIDCCRRLGSPSRTMKDLEAELPKMSDKAQDQLLNVLKDADVERAKLLRRHRGVPVPKVRGIK